MATTTLICEGRVVEVAAHVDGDKVRLPADALRAALGWELKPEGLCKADQCIPIRQRAGLVDDTGVDLLESHTVGTAVRVGCGRTCRLPRGVGDRALQSAGVTSCA